MYRFFAFSIIAICFMGCGSSLRLINQGEQVSQISSGNGLLFLPIESKGFFESIFISGETELVVKKNQFQLFELPAGEYQIEKIDFGHGYIDLTESENPGIWRFNVSEGKLNYAGHLIVEKIEGRYASYDLINRSSSALKTLKDKYNQLLDKFELHYSGMIQDDFFLYVRELEKGRKQ
ncbi:MAG: hypothetical protein OQJ89_09755 [Kangiellaceae bacterium]|nr:hypothetical protein [Kangiellaceae bacterium]MCW8998175.1 hypothetical protein [Kangiellaceae bacterium]MCW9017239.1 hypothetical protein [Kangiellaceae bacterium]